MADESDPRVEQIVARQAPEIERLKDAVSFRRVPCRSCTLWRTAWNATEQGRLWGRKAAASAKAAGRCGLSFREKRTRNSKARPGQPSGTESFTHSTSAIPEKGCQPRSPRVTKLRHARQACG